MRKDLYKGEVEAVCCNVTLERRILSNGQFIFPFNELESFKGAMKVIEKLMTETPWWFVETLMFIIIFGMIGMQTNLGINFFLIFGRQRFSNK